MSKVEEKFIEELNKEHEIILGFQEYEKKIDDETLNMLVKEHKLYKDIEAKLAESEEQVKEELVEKKGLERALSACNRQNDEFADMIKKLVSEKEELKQQLEKSEKSKESYRLQNVHHHLQLLQFYSRLGVEAFGADIHEKALETLMIMKEQLAEKEKELAEYADINNTLNSGLQEKCILCEEEHNKDKISFAVEQLEKVKELLNTDFESTISWIDTYEDGEYLNSMTYNHNNTIKIIDNQIKQLKEGQDV